MTKELKPCPGAGGVMTDNELYGLSLKEQATFLWALCRYSSNPETCPIILMRDFDNCPFEDVDCENIPQWDWLALVLANAGCGIPLTEYIGEAVNGMSPPAPEHWREAARKAVETSHEN